MNGYVWEGGRLGPGEDGYLHWELRDSGTPERPVILPVFVSLPCTDPKEGLMAIQALAATGGVVLSPHERSRAEALLATGAPADGTLELVVCAPPGAISGLPGTVISIGSPMSEGLTAGDASAATRSTGRGPVVAVIDDAIGYLNARFRAAPDRTRFDAIWIMGPDLGAAGMTGQVLRTADIDARLASGRDEVDIYAEDNDRIFRPGTHKPTNLRFGHGTHVLDLAAGEDFAATPDSPRLLAVQLPPEAVVATSGRRLEHFILMGLRWILGEIAQNVASGSPPQAVVVVLSLGGLAGPKTGQGFFESSLARTLADFGLTCPGVPVRVMAAYGNARRGRLVGRADLAPGTSVDIGWRVLPDDHTSSYLELRVPTPALDRIGLVLTPPGPLPPLTMPALPAPGEFQALTFGTDLVAAVYAVAEGTETLILFALGPTASDRTRSLCEPGLWQIALHLNGKENVAVSIRIRRDDTPVGYRLRGRQSYLDTPTGWMWDNETLDWSMTASEDLVTRSGTDVNFSSAGAPALYLVAAGEPDPSKSLGLRPATYSSEGDSSAGTAPTFAARSDDGRNLNGRLAAGILSGSAIRLSGTSVAAPLAASALVAHLRAGQSLSAALSGQFPPASERDALLAGPALPSGNTRIGAGWLDEPPGRDRRPDLR